MASKILDSPVRSDHEWGGAGYIAGSGAGDPAGLATRGGAPSSIRLVLFRKLTMRPISIQWSLSNGHYQFNNLSPSEKFFLVGFDHLFAYQAGITDEITPKV